MMTPKERMTNQSLSRVPSGRQAWCLKEKPMWAATLEATPSLPAFASSAEEPRRYLKK
jgi:hypothetical protein